MKLNLTAAACLLPIAAFAQSSPLLELNDPEGDDFGDGSLVYPRGAFVVPGDLDLRTLRVFEQPRGGLRFEAVFRNPIRHPSTARPPGLGSEDLSIFARRGFYAFNLDLYLDTDRVPGSGNTATLPGRGATVDRANAWDKAIVLTPRPELMRRQLIDAMSRAAPAGGADVEASVDRSVHFATDVQVRGRTVSFAVPAGFIDRATFAGASMFGFVTAAQLAIAADLGGLVGRPNAGAALERLTLGVAQPEPGRPQFAPGYDTDSAPPTAIVDLLNPDPRQQAIQLAPRAALAAIGTAVAAPAAPAAPPASAGVGGDAERSWFSRALDAVGRLFDGKAAPSAAPAAVAAPAAPLVLPAPAAAVAAPAPVAPTVAAPAPTPAPARAAAPAAGLPAAPATPPRAAGPSTPSPAPPAGAPPAPRPRDPGFADEIEQRLTTLKRLRDRGLITEEEYQQKRKEILALL